jgi:cysteinyl-tRNA synthetase
MVVFDMVSRYFRYRGYEVTYVRNITDIDDKIIARASEQNIGFRELTEKFIAAMHEDTQALGVLAPDYEPKATDSVDLIIALIEKLMEIDAAYIASNGDIYARVERFAEYGKLSGKKLEDLRAGERIEVDSAKDSPFDFALWKKAKPGEPKWGSPWGEGRPGWHIECCAMSMDLLGETFDIHGGGVDLQFPHHENEIMLAETVTHKPFANYWMHNGHVKVQSAQTPGEYEKMAKSLGNFFTIRDILKEYRPEEVRWLLLSSHYRSPLNYSEEGLLQARQTLTRYYLALRNLEVLPDEGVGESYHREFLEAMDADFNTPRAMAVLAQLVGEINRLRQHPDTLKQAGQLAGLLRSLGSVLGLLESDPDHFLRQEHGTVQQDGLTDQQINDLIECRQLARAAKNWAEADRVRQQLLDAGVVIEDGAQGTSWRRGM